MEREVLGGGLGYRILERRSSVAENICGEGAPFFYVWVEGECGGERRGI